MSTNSPSEVCLDTFSSFYKFMWLCIKAALHAPKMNAKLSLPKLSLLGQEMILVPGMGDLVPAAAFHFCLSLHATYFISQPITIVTDMDVHFS